MKKIITTLGITALLLVSVTQLVKAAPEKNPFFATLEYVNQLFSNTDQRINDLEARLEAIENSEFLCDLSQDQVSYKDAAEQAGQTIEEYLEAYLDTKGQDGWTLYNTQHVPLGAGDIFYFKKCLGYENEPDWEYHVALLTPAEVDDYVAEKEAAGWETLSVLYVNWDPGAVLFFRKAV